MNRFKVEAIIPGESKNEVASKLMVSAYVNDFDIEELTVTRINDRTKKFLAEDTNIKDNDPDDVFQFPHVRAVVDHLRNSKE